MQGLDCHYKSIEAANLESHSFFSLQMRGSTVSTPIFDMTMPVILFRFILDS